MKIKSLATTLILSAFLSSKVYPKINPYKIKKNKVELQASGCLIDNLENDAFGIDVCGKAKRRFWPDVWMGIYGKYSPPISKINSPLGFGGTISVTDYGSFSEAEFKIGLEKENKKYLGIVSFGGYREINEKWSCGGGISVSSDLNFDLSFGAKAFMVRSFSW